MNNINKEIKQKVEMFRIDLFHDVTILSTKNKMLEYYEPNGGIYNIVPDRIMAEEIIRLNQDVINIIIEEIKSSSYLWIRNDQEQI